MPNISGPRLAELERAARELADMRECNILAPFADRFARALGTLAANTPYNRWPEEFRTALRWCALDTPDLARLYRDRLPTE